MEDCSLQSGKRPEHLPHVLEVEDTDGGLGAVEVRLEEDGDDEVLEDGEMTDGQEILPPGGSESPDRAPLRVSVPAMTNRESAEARDLGQTEVEHLQGHSVVYHELRQTGAGGGDVAPGQLPGVVLLVAEDDPGVAELQQVNLRQGGEDKAEVKTDVGQGHSP